MRLLSRKEDVIRLWLCDKFIPAFHFVHGKDHDEQKDRFDRIRNAGYLRPGNEVGSSNMYILDLLASDDQYVFLSAVRPAMGLGAGTDFGFVFNAVELLQNGAVYGEGDLLRDYERAVQVVAARYFYPDDAHTAAFHAHQRSTYENRDKFFNFTGWGRDKQTKVWEFLPEIVDALTEIQTKSRFTGSAAIDQLMTWARISCTGVRDLLAMAQGNLEAASPAFRSWFAITMRSRPRPSRREACSWALRNVIASEPLMHQVQFGGSPEILWPGRLPIDRAVYAFALPKAGGRLFTGFSWIDDLFRLACYDKA